MVQLLLLSLQSCLNPNGPDRSFVGSPVEIYLENCVFSRASGFFGHGGVIFFDTYYANLSVIETTFYSCHVYGDSHCGAVYFQCPGGQAYFYRVCANNCSAESTTHFCYSNTGDNNAFHMCSVTRCSPELRGYFPIFCWGGKQSIKSTNISKCSVYQESGIRLYQCPFLEILHSTFFSNRALSHMCIYITGTQYPTSIKYSNIIDNDSPAANSVVHVGSGSLTIQYSVFQSNKDLLLQGAEPIVVIDSVISHPSSQIGVISQSKNVTFKTTASMNIIHYDTYRCRGAQIPTKQHSYNEVLYKRKINVSLQAFMVIALIH